MTGLPAAFTAARFIVLARILTAVFGCAAAVWGLTTLPQTWRQTSAEFIARRVLNGEPYKPEVLSRQFDLVKSTDGAARCRPAAARSTAVISLRMTELAAQRDAGKPIEAPQMQTLDAAVRDSLSCSPADPFLWLVLYWIETTQNGLKPDHWKYLKLSYQLGPNEGWIALKRNALVMAEFERLPPDLVSDAIQEFLTMIKNGFYRETAEIFGAVTPQTRETIIPRLATLSRQNRTTFARVVSDRGLDVTIPETDLPPSKPAIDFRAISR